MLQSAAPLLEGKGACRKVLGGRGEKEKEKKGEEKKKRKEKRGKEEKSNNGKKGRGKGLEK